VTKLAARVLVVDDDEAILLSLERGLLLAGFDVETASGGTEALEAVRSAPPDAMVLDVTMPDVDGVTVLRRLRADGDDIPVCVLSARGEVAERVAGLQAGADDYLVKPFDLDELVARLHALLRRRSPLPSARITVGDLDIDPGRRRARRGARALDLTRREFDLLHAFAAHSGQVLTRGQLLELVWGYDFPVQDNAVDVFVGYLRRKLEDDGETRVIQTIRGVGFVLRPA
jgi:DNA-binding response OmpR family regulator